jgi:hypothetical protein
LKKFKQAAYRKKKSLTGFLKKLDRIVPHDMPKLVAATDKEVWEEVKCLDCSNCCKTMTPTFTPTDIKRISTHLGMTAKSFKEKWLFQDADNGDWVNKTQPCQFLLKSNKCSIYDVRPRDCAEFPHHKKKPFDLYTDTFTNNLHHCPATLTLVQNLKKKVEENYEW